MDWSNILLNGAVMALYFNLFALVVLILNPRYMMSYYPKDILKSAQPQTAKERSVYKKCRSAMLIIPIFYGAGCNASSGCIGFWQLFFAAYIQWIAVSLSDFIIQDIFLQQKFRRRIILSGTQGHIGYKSGQWLVKLALPRHFIVWPLLTAPSISILQAFISLLLIKIGAQL